MTSEWAIAALPALALALTLVNRVTWRRGGAAARFDGTVSVLIPARNEAERIGACLDAISASHHPIHEILVYDDESTDDTRAVVAARGARDPRVRLVPTHPLPAGWVGKVHGCERLARAARGDLLVYVDADVRLESDGIARLASFFTAGGPAVVSAVPRQEMGTLAERVVMPFLLLTYLSFLPLELVAKTRDVRVVAANGQLLAVRRDALEGLGFFRRIASEIVDDVAFCRVAKRAGLVVAFADGTDMARCRMYRSGRALAEGFAKNIAEGVGGLAGVAFSIALYLATFLLPWLALGAGVAAGDDAWSIAGAAGVGANLVQRAVVARRWRQPAIGIALHPFGLLAVIALALRSLVWTLRGRVRWSGRVYAARADRGVPA